MLHRVVTLILGPCWQNALFHVTICHSNGFVDAPSATSTNRCRLAVLRYTCAAETFTFGEVLTSWSHVDAAVFFPRPPSLRINEVSIAVTNLRR